MPLIGRVDLPRRRGDCELRLVARKLYDDRRKRDHLFNSGLFGEPAWDMLLALYADDTSERALDVTWLARTARVPQSSAVRWQWMLVEEALIEFGPVTPLLVDRTVRLTGKGRKLMERCLLQSCLSERSGSEPKGNES